MTDKRHESVWGIASPRAREYERTPDAAGLVIESMGNEGLAFRTLLDFVDPGASALKDELVRVIDLRLLGVTDGDRVRV